MDRFVADPNYFDPDLWGCYVIDGTIDNQTEIHSFDYQHFSTKSNAITILSPYDKFLGYVFNPKSEADKLIAIISLAIDGSVASNGGGTRSLLGKPGAVQVVNFETNGIIMDRFVSENENCTAYVLSGPQNNSKVLLDLCGPNSSDSG